MNAAGVKVGRVSLLDTSGRFITRRYWPFAYTALPVASPPWIGASFVGPFAVTSATPLPFSHRSRYTASELSPMRKYGRSVPDEGCGGNCSEIASAKSFFAGSSVDWVGSSHVRWNATSLSL